MGQRTQMLVIKRAENGEKRVSFYHNQWGFGRCMFLGVMELFIQYYNSDEYSFGSNAKERARNFLFGVGKLDYKGSNFVNELSPTNKWDKDYWDKQIDKVKAVDIDDLNSVLQVCECGDNNNGWCVVEITQGKEAYDKPNFRIGWLLGNEETSHTDKFGNIMRNLYYHKWVTSEQYAKLNGGHNYSDNKFSKMFCEFRDYFEIKEMAELDCNK